MVQLRCWEKPDHVSELWQCSVGVAHLSDDVLHLPLYPLHLVQPQLVYLGHGEVGGGVELQTLSVELRSHAWQATHGDVCKNIFRYNPLLSVTTKKTL